MSSRVKPGQFRYAQDQLGGALIAEADPAASAAAAGAPRGGSIEISCTIPKAAALGFPRPT
ncbi:hypothetical protein AB0M94_38720 [Streptomyces xanthochromogenes]|uniref:hypothetical protein n=1 Tax=Streptomyces xanthochromogenes TaxID=67384 RepID=UPI0034318CAC